jgi:hypothetical protein
MGSNVTDWSDFHLKINMLATDLRYRGVPCSSMNGVASYSGGVLRLDPMVIMEGSRYLKGSASLDFYSNLAEFDAETTMNPGLIEDMILPQADLFDGSLHVDGEVYIDGSGRVDWASMQSTDFAVEVSAERFALPVAASGDFKALVTCNGTDLAVSDAKFSLYGGEAEASLSVRVDPSAGSMPYDLEISARDSDLARCMQFLQKGKESEVAGTFRGSASIQADLATNFFSSANGTARLKIRKGQLADLPLMRGFSRLMRKVLPGFSIFTITSLSGDYTITEGVVSSENTHFGGDIISASARGKYSSAEGFDAYVQAELLSSSGLTKVVRVLTDPLMKFLEIKLEGSFEDPSWRLEKFPENISNLFKRKKD